MWFVGEEIGLQRPVLSELLPWCSARRSLSLTMATLVDACAVLERAFDIACASLHGRRARVLSMRI